LEKAVQELDKEILCQHSFSAAAYNHYSLNWRQHSKVIVTMDNFEESPNVLSTAMLMTFSLLAHPRSALPL
jgi:hypothetical protein